MCILFAAVNKHQQFPIIIATNRDEYISRETTPANYNLFQNAENIFGGKDNKGEGTWLGIDIKRGRFSCVLNVVLSEKIPKGSPSRGELPLQYLMENDNQTPKNVIERILNSEENEKQKYAGFTLICVDCLKNQKPRFVLGTNSYCQKKGECKIWDISMDEGIYGLTNDGALLRTYSNNEYNDDDQIKIKYWNKVNRGCEILNKILLDEYLNNKPIEKLANNLLETLLHNTEIDNTKFHGNNPIFLPWNNYCTRTSQVILFDQNNTIHFFSRNYLDETKYESKYEKIIFDE